MYGESNGLSNHAYDEGGRAARGQGEIVHVECDHQHPGPSRVEQHHQVEQDDFELRRGEARTRRDAAGATHGLGIDAVDPHHPP